MGSKCPCANPPGKGVKRPIPRKPSTKVEPMVVTNSDQSVPIKMQSSGMSRLKWIYSRSTTNQNSYFYPKSKVLGGFITIDMKNQR